MTAAHAKALVEALLAGGSTAEAIATAVKVFIAPEAKPIIDGLVAGGASAEMVAATAKEFVDQLAAKRAKESRGRAERRARARLSADVRGQSADTVPANVPPTPPLNLNLVDDEDAARARAADETLLRIAAPTLSVADRVAADIEQTVKDDGHWPKAGWVHSVVAEQVTQFLKAGVSAQLMLDAVRIASKRAPAGPISTFRYFIDTIVRAQNEARAQLHLPLITTISGGQIGRTVSESIDQAFERFWSTYPNPVGMDAAAALYRKIVTTGRATIAEMQAGAEAYAAKCRHENRAEKYIKNPTTWMEEGCWKDRSARGSRGGSASSAIDWSRHVSEFKVHRNWLPSLGPAPDCAGCRAPPDVLRQHGFGNSVGVA
jgi:hypothetical protein